MTAHSGDDVFGASRKMVLTSTTFLVYILPPIVCLYIIGVLVQLRGTQFYRLALLPILVWFSWRGIFVDMSGGDPKQGQMNAVLIVSHPSPVWHAINVAIIDLYVFLLNAGYCVGRGTRAFSPSESLEHRWETGFRHCLHSSMECLGLDGQHAWHWVELAPRTRRPQAHL